jgi:hypothetical protein
MVLLGGAAETMAFLRRVETRLGCVGSGRRNGLGVMGGPARNCFLGCENEEKRVTRGCYKRQPTAMELACFSA